MYHRPDRHQCCRCVYHRISQSCCQYSDLCLQTCLSCLSMDIIWPLKPSLDLVFCASSFAKNWMRRSLHLEILSNCPVSLLVFCAQMPNFVGFTQTKKLQEGPLHQEHETARHTQWKVWRQHGHLILLTQLTGLPLQFGLIQYVDIMEVLSAFHVKLRSSLT